MKLYFIKIGKVFTTIRRDGFIIGGRRVIGYLKVFLSTLFNFSKGDVLIITGGVGDSAHYRAFNQAEELNMHGLKTSVIIQDSPMLSIYARRFDVFIFHRVIVTPMVTALINRIKKLKKEIIFETDDLVFDAQFIQRTDLYKNNMTALERLQYSHGVGEEILKDGYVKVATTTTGYLAERLASYGKKVFIVRNKLSQREQKICEGIFSDRIKTDDIMRETGKIHIGYISGTHSHNKDFATISDALIGIMDKYREVSLVLAGPLDVQNKLQRFQKRIYYLPLVPRGEHYKNIAKLDINLAPLVLGDPFCESKSELKFFEAGILGIPTVAVRNRTFSSAIEDGVDGYLADHAEEWVEKISRLIEDEKFRNEMGQKARKKVIEEYTVKNSHETEYYDYLKSRLKAIS